MTTPGINDAWRPSPASWALVAVAWILVGIPLAWGIYKTLQTAVALFR
ncbi:MAG TPA: hypothetical protein VK647_07565 [Gemmatimonadales bacterium]|jgi:hypothetical protein|nr:hypothetical protein [Gemmatimonadales bacterium]